MASQASELLADANNCTHVKLILKETRIVLPLILNR